MAPKHGTRQRYGAGCRCGNCKDAQAIYQRKYRERKANGETRPVLVAPVLQLQPTEPGPVASAVEAELGCLAEAQLRPSLAQAALAMARLLDNPKAVNQQPAPAKVLAALLDKFRSASAGGRRGGLALVRTMTGGTTSD
jgi:hypothetical protein